MRPENEREYRQRKKVREKKEAAAGGGSIFNIEEKTREWVGVSASSVGQQRKEEE